MDRLYERTVLDCSFCPYCCVGSQYIICDHQEKIIMEIPDRIINSTRIYTGTIIKIPHWCKLKQTRKGITLYKKIIKNCNRCPHAEKENYYLICDKSKRILIKGGRRPTIPDWCELPIYILQGENIEG